MIQLIYTFNTLGVTYTCLHVHTSVPPFKIFLTSIFLHDCISSFIYISVAPTQKEIHSFCKPPEETFALQQQLINKLTAVRAAQNDFQFGCNCQISYVFLNFIQTFHNSTLTSKHTWKERYLQIYNRKWVKGNG